MGLYGVKNYNERIDIDTIQKACEEINTAAEDFKNAAAKIDEAKANASGDNLSVDGKTMEESFEIVRQGHDKIYDQIVEFTNDVMNNANKIYTAQTKEIENYQSQQSNQ